MEQNDTRRAPPKRKRLSLAPLGFRDALSDLLQVKPPSGGWDRASETVKTAPQNTNEVLPRHPPRKA